MHMPAAYELLRKVFVAPDVLKLGFRFKQDLVYLSSTFCERGCSPGFDRVSFDCNGDFCLLIAVVAHFYV